MCRYKNECGRSMIEMLGVLAIIGVLSVGAIAGYQKAMFKYKANGFINAYSQLIGNILEYREHFNKVTYDSLVMLFKKINIIPDGMTVNGALLNEKYFKSRVRPFARKGFVSFDIYLDQSISDGIFKTDICQMLYSNIAIPYHENIHRAWMYRGPENDYGSFWYGDKYCDPNNTSYNKCLKNMKLSDIQATCNECLKDSDCILNIEF